MINALWIAKTGMQAQQNQLDIISNNLANVSTNGYKRASAIFEDLMYQNMRQVGASSSQQSQLPTGLQVGLGVRTVATQRSFTQGSLQQTGNNMDVAINGQGFFQITMPDGTNAYTRDGAFQVDPLGRLVTSSGFALSDNITIPANAKGVTISADGVVSVTQANSAAVVNVGTINLVGFMNPAGLEPKGQNLYSESASSGAPVAGAAGTNGLGNVMQGYVEGSNVNVVQELVAMIQTQRSYEMNSKAIQTADQMLQKLGQV